jgi:hypothetical protein
MPRDANTAPTSSPDRNVRDVREAQRDAGTAVKGSPERAGEPEGRADARQAQRQPDPTAPTSKPGAVDGHEATPSRTAAAAEARDRHVPAVGRAGEGPTVADAATARPSTAAAPDNATRFREALASLQQQNATIRATGSAGPIGAAGQAPAGAQALGVAAQAVRAANPALLKDVTERPERAVLEGAKTATQVAAVVYKPLAVATKPVEKITDAIQKSIDRSDGGPARDR